MAKIVLVPFLAADLVTLSAVDAIRSAERVFLQTKLHPMSKRALALRPDAETMDDLYETAEDFDALADAIAQRLVSARDCAYVFTGSISDSVIPAIERAAAEADIAVKTLAGGSIASAAFPEKRITTVLAAASLPDHVSARFPLAVEEIDSFIRAGETKLLLSEYFPDDWEICVADMDETGHFTHQTIPLYALDRRKHFTPSTCVWLDAVPFERRTRCGLDDVMEVTHRLRAPDGCPWDREQTHETLKISLLEECYELLDAIDEGDDIHIREELGDVLLQVAMHSVIAEDFGRFTERDVATDLVKKLIYRHPHVFGDAVAKDAGDVLKNWDALKKVEKGQDTVTDAIRSIPRNLPALIYSRKVQKKAAGVGFDWDSASEAAGKIPEELDELMRAMSGDGNADEEMGDLLFSVVNVARLLHQDPELLLRDATDKFSRRFADMERVAAERGCTLDKMTFDEQNAIWDAVKAKRNGVGKFKK